MAVEVVGGWRGRGKGRVVMGKRGRKKCGVVKKVPVKKDPRKVKKKKNGTSETQMERNN